MCIQGEIYVIPYSLRVTGRHLWYITHPDVGECLHWPCIPCFWISKMSVSPWKFADISFVSWDPSYIWSVSRHFDFNFTKPKAPQEMCLGSPSSRWKPHQKIPICSGDTGGAAFAPPRFALQKTGRSSRVNPLINTSGIALEHHFPFRLLLATVEYGRNRLGQPRTVRIRRVTPSAGLRRHTVESGEVSQCGEGPLPSGPLPSPPWPIIDHTDVRKENKLFFS